MTEQLALFEAEITHGAENQLAAYSYDELIKLGDEHHSIDPESDIFVAILGELHRRASTGDS